MICAWSALGASSRWGASQFALGETKVILSGAKNLARRQILRFAQDDDRYS
jgi:hypothetical protein